MKIRNCLAVYFTMMVCFVSVPEVSAQESLQPVADWLTSINVKNGSKEYTAEALSKAFSLRLAVKKEVTDETISKYVCQLTTLQSLSLDGTSVTNAGLAHLPCLTKLRSLDLGSLKGVNGAGFESLAKLPALVDLNLQSSGVTIEDLKKLPQVLPNLQILNLSWLQVNEALPELAKLTQLTSFNLFHSDLNDTGAVSLGKMTTLQKLYIWNTVITDAGMAHLKDLKNITLIYISDTQMTDKGMEALSGMSKLDYLWMNNLPITDEGLKKLVTCSALRSVQARQTKITDAGVAALTQAIPAVKVYK